MIQPISFENDKFLIHTFRSEELKHFDQLATEVYAILSDKQTLRYLPGKRLQSVQEAEQFLQGMLLNFYAERNYLHFIRDKQSGKVVGMIDLISPELAKEHYQIERYPFFLEFYLSSQACGCFLMTEILPIAIDQFLNQGISHIAAVVNRENIAAKKVLKKARFRKKQAFDFQQDFYELKVA